MTIAFTLLMAVIIPAWAAEEVEYHMPADIIKIVEQSNLTYEIDQIGKNDKLPQIKLELNEHGTFLKKEKDGSFTITTYALEQENNPRFTSLLAEAEKEFNTRNFSAAREKYQEILNIDPNNSQIMTYLGQICEEEKRPDQAIEMYRKAIVANFLDYMAHWFLADMLVINKKLDEAVGEITIAHILNRNNPRILDGLRVVYKKAGRSYPEWVFTPRHIIALKSPEKVLVKVDMSHSVWMGYGLCKAVWKYEPNYRETMLKNTSMNGLLIEEIECLLNIAGPVMGNEDKKPTDPAICTLIRAVEKNRIQDYAFYEIILRQEPQLAFYLDPENIQPLVNYLLEIRSEKMPHK